MKKFTVILFICFIFVVPIVTLVTPDKKVSYLENKILQKLPDLNFDSVISTKFMSDFDKYTTDQFPMRTNFIKIKNIYSYLIGNREFRNVYVSKDNRLLEKFTFNKNTIDKNIESVSNISKLIHNKYNINSTLMVIPTSVAFYSDSLYNYMITDNQSQALSYINNTFLEKSLTSKFYNPFDVLNNNKSEYIYFNTDHHWTQLGAKLVYEDMYKYKVSDKPIAVANDFYGTYYSKAIIDFIQPDTIYAYEGYNNFNINMDFNYNYNTLYDKTKLNNKNKYQYFLHGDPAIGVIDGNKYIDKEILIFKDSFAHSFIPFLTSNYSKIHFIDPRYYKFDIDDYLSKNDIDEVLFMHNISSFNSENLY